MMAAAREGAGPDTEIFVECGERLSPRTAVMAAQAFAPYRPAWFEEPIPFENARAMARLQRDLPVPIATGERLLSRWEYRELLEEGGCRIVQPDVMHAAGITEVRKIAAMADTAYIPVAPHNPGGPICLQPSPTSTSLSKWKASGRCVTSSVHSPSPMQTASSSFPPRPGWAPI